MKRGFVFTATLAALTLGLVACGGNNSTPVKDVTINNKDVLSAEWYVEDEDRNINMSIEGVRIAEAIDEGDLVVTSSDPAVFTVATSMQKIHAVGKGTATLTATYKNKKSDSVEISVKLRPTMRVVTDLDTSRDDYFLRWYANGKTLFASDQMNSYYIKPVLIDDEATKNVSVKEVVGATGDYKYAIKIGEKEIGAYKGTHNNIGFVGDEVEDSGKHPLTQALFKFNQNYSISTNFFGETEYFLAAYGGARDDRLAFQTASGIPDAAFARLVEYGDPIPATSITLDKTTLEMKDGQLASLTATIEPAISTDVVKWSVEPLTGVLKVVDGKVAAIGQGNATITATAGSKTATCQVTVSGAVNYGTEAQPLTPEEAHALIADNFADGSCTVKQLYVKGVAKTVTKTYADSDNLTIQLENSDGTFTAKFFTVYGATVESGVTAPVVGDLIVAKGYAKVYNEEYELAPGKAIDETKNTNPSILSSSAAPAPDLKGIEVTPEEASVNLFEKTETQKVTLEAKPYPERAILGQVNWACSDPEIVVTDGVVSVPADYVAAGGEAKTLTITATCGMFSDTAVITVENKDTSGKVTVTFDAKAYAEANEAVSGTTKLNAYDFDTVAKFTLVGTDANTGKMYGPGSSTGLWEVRAYKSGTATLTITVAEGYKLVSVTGLIGNANWDAGTQRTLTIENNKVVFNNSNANFNIKSLTVVYQAA